MAPSNSRPLTDVIKQLGDPERWQDVSYQDTLRFADFVCQQELQSQMHLAAIGDPGFSPATTASLTTAIRLGEIHHRDEIRFRSGG